MYRKCTVPSASEDMELRVNDKNIREGRLSKTVCCRCLPTTEGTA